MELVTALRSQMPVAGDLPAPSGAAPAGSGAAGQATGVPPVADVQHPAAVRAADPKPQADRHLAPPPADPPHAALSEAEAARRAYIRASIVAGLNPLPLPGG